MNRRKFKISDEEWEEILRINKEGGDPVMYLSGGTPIGRSKQEKINDYWDKLAKEKGFDVSTIEPVDQRHFTAIPTKNQK